MVGSIVFGVFSMVFCLLFCWFRTEKPTVYSLVLKTAASICFIMCAIFAINAVEAGNINLLMLAGLVLGLVGDILLDLKIMYSSQSNEYFIAGTSAFAIGHFFYFLSAILFNNAIVPTHLPWNILISFGVAIILTLGIIFSSKKMGLNFGKMLYIVIFYSFVLTFMVSFTVSIAIFSPIYWIVAVGMILFFLSDLVLSMQYFGGNTAKSMVYLNHVLYYLAQLCLAFSILYLVI